MTGRHGYDTRPERQNEYFVPGDGISREVIQADICRYLGNDALVRPGNHNGRPGYFIRAYRNLTSEMITDLKADSARWEAEMMRRADQGYPRAPYQTSTTHEQRQVQGPSSPTPPFGAHPVQPYSDPYSQHGAIQTPYGPTQSPQYPASSYPASSYPASSYQASYPSGTSPFAPGQNPYPPVQVPYSGQGQPPVTAAEAQHQAYTYTNNPPYGYDPGRNNAPRYTGAGYEAEQDYSPVTSGIAYPPQTAPDPRIQMDQRYTPESMSYQDRNNRPQPARGGERRR